MGNLRQILDYDGGIFLRWAGNSLLYAGLGSAVGTLLALAAGYGLARFSYRGRSLSMALVVGSFLIPYSMLTLPLYLLFSKIGLVGSMWAVLIPTFINPFSVYLSKVYIEAAVPTELIEAARIDGAGEVRIFFSIVLRMLTTAGATVFLLAFVASWNGFFLPVTMLQDSDTWTLSLGLYNWLRQSQVSNAGTVDFTSIVITGSLLSVIPLAAVMISLQRFWRTGVTLGASNEPSPVAPAPRGRAGHATGPAGRQPLRRRLGRPDRPGRAETARAGGLRHTRGVRRPG